MFNCEKYTTKYVRKNSMRWHKKTETTLKAEGFVLYDSPAALMPHQLYL